MAKKRKTETTKKKKKPDRVKERIRQVGSAYQTGKDVVDLFWDFFGG